MTADNIGCVEEAEFIFTWVKALNTSYHWDFKRNVPEGWEFLGSGSYRSTWRSPSGVAYKVQHRTGSYQNNKGEYDKILKSQKREPLPGVRLPRCSFYNSFTNSSQFSCIAFYCCLICSLNSFFT